MTVKKKKLTMKKVLILSVSLIVIAGIAVGVFFATADMRTYNKAQKLLEEEDYSKAAELFHSLNDYKDAKEMADEADALLVEEQNEALYEEATDDFENGRFQNAIDKFNQLGNYKNSIDRAEKAKQLLQVKNDKEPPEITFSLSQIVLTSEDNQIALEEWLKYVVSIEDNVTKNIDYEIQSSSVDYGIPGSYSVTISCSDEAGNASSGEIQVIISHPACEAYEEAVTLSLEDLEGPSATGHYTYKGLTIQDDDIDWLFTSWGSNANYLSQDALYNAVAKGLEGYDLFTEIGFYGSWGQSLVPLVFGIDKPDSAAEIEPYVRNAQEFIVQDDSEQLSAIMNKMQQLECVSGEFDFEDNIYDFKISNLTQAAEDMMISDAMLGYIIADLDCYKGAEISFKGDTASIVVNLQG